MKKLVAIFSLFVGVKALAFPETLLECQMPSNSSKQFFITISHDAVDSGYGNIFAVISAGAHSFESQLYTNLQWRSDSSHYRPENYRIFGRDFFISYEDFSGVYRFSGIVSNKPYNQKISCK